MVLEPLKSFVDSVQQNQPHLKLILVLFALGGSTIQVFNNQLNIVIFNIEYMFMCV